MSQKNTDKKQTYTMGKYVILKKNKIPENSSAFPSSDIKLSSDNIEELMVLSAENGSG